MLGSCASNYPSVVRRAYEEGHQICSHSYDHPALTTKTNDQIKWQMDKTDSILDSILGMDFTYTIRPPYGDVNDRVISVLGNSYNSPSVIWSVDPYDWRDLNSYTVASRVVSGSFDGAIVLVHDIYGTTVTGILSAIDTLKAYGYEFVTLNELYRRRGKEIPAGEKIYYCKPSGNDLGAVEAPVIYEMTGYDSRQVFISAPAGATVYYTLDGSNPVYSKQIYTGCLTVSPGTRIRAVAAYNLNGSRSTETQYTTSIRPYLSPISVEVRDGKIHMNNPNPNTEIRFTVNGSTVAENSNLYYQPLNFYWGELRYRLYGKGVDVPEEILYVTEKGNIFNDVPLWKWYAHTVDRAVTEGFFNGMGNYTFAPTKGVNRAMFITVAYRLMERLGVDVSYETPANYPDATEEWYADALSWGTEQGIVNGYTDGSFKPDKEITREEMCTILSRMMQWYGFPLQESGTTFEDQEEISSWALADVVAMSAMELIQGYEDFTFRPQNTANRAQAAAVILRAYDYLLTTELPEVPENPEETISPETPEDPQVPTEPETPVEPEIPTEPETPVEPEDSTEPEDTDNSVDTEGSSDSEDPGDPEMSVESDTEET